MRTVQCQFVAVAMLFVVQILSQQNYDTGGTNQDVGEKNMVHDIEVACNRRSKEKISFQEESGFFSKVMLDHHALVIAQG